jgi:glycosyltransferase involved in cell wall biosynthesis
MRIAFVVYGGLDQISGGFLYDRMVVDRLSAAGVTVDVLALPWWAPAPALAQNALPLPFAAADYDVVVEDELCHPALVLRNRGLRRAGVPVVALCHNLASRQPGTPVRPLARALERAYFAGVDGVVAVCESTRRDVEALLARPYRAVVAYAGRDHQAPELDEAAVAARAAAPGPLRVLAVAAVMPHKGLHRLLPALARAGERALELDVAGSLTKAPGYVRQIRSQLSTLGLESRVRLHGELRAEALAALYRQCHVLALPSDREAYPLAGVEALGFGLPLLVTDEGGTGELIRSEREGLLLAPDDIAAWAAALVRLAGDRALLEVWGRAALARHRAHGPWAETAARVRQLCAELIALRRARVGPA